MKIKNGKIKDVKPQPKCGGIGVHRHYCEEIAQLQHMLTLVRKHEKDEEVKKLLRQLELARHIIADTEQVNKRLIAELEAK